MKIIYDEKGFKADLPGILLLSHGPMAAAMVESAQMILGDIMNIAAVSLEKPDAPDDLYRTIAEYVTKFPAGCIVLVDIFAGTPSNQFQMYAVEHGNDNLYALSGLSLPMLLETVLMRDAMELSKVVESVTKNIQESVINIIEKIESLKC